MYRPPARAQIKPEEFVRRAASRTGALTAPLRIPDHVAKIEDPLEAPAIESAAPSLGVVGLAELAGEAVSRTLTDLVSRIQKPPAPVAAVAKETPKAPPPSAPLQVGGRIQDAKLVYGPKPVYPQLARQARISGVVRLSALISREGRIRNLTVISGHPLLVPAALEAVKQWIYRPTVLNDVAVEVATDIQVMFTIDRGQ